MAFVFCFGTMIQPPKQRFFIIRWAGSRFYLLPYRSDIFKVLLWIIIEVHNPTG